MPTTKPSNHPLTFSPAGLDHRPHEVSEEAEVTSVFVNQLGNQGVVTKLVSMACASTVSTERALADWRPMK